MPLGTASLEPQYCPSQSLDFQIVTIMSVQATTLPEYARRYKKCPAPACGYEYQLIFVKTSAFLACNGWSTIDLHARF